MLQIEVEIHDPPIAQLIGHLHLLHPKPVVLHREQRFGHIVTHLRIIDLRIRIAPDNCAARR